MTDEPSLCKCANCGEVGSIVFTELHWMPFACQSCGYWGYTENTTDNLQPDDGWNPTGQIHPKPTE